MSHTTRSTPDLFASSSSSTVPFFPQKGKPQYRILVKPDIQPEQTLEGGLFVPQDAMKICETGIVVSSYEDCSIQPGDAVWYAIIPRGPGAASATVYLEGQLHHMLLETEVWAVNEYPVNRLYVRALSNVSVDEEGLAMPENSNGLQKGVVVRAPMGSVYFREGDDVLYRRNENISFPDVNVDGVICSVLFEREVYMVNNRVSPYRMLIKIDKKLQAEMQMVGDSNLVAHPLFQYMRHYLQWGRIAEMGHEAEQMYRWLSVGDYIALHHTIEHQDHRVVKTIRGKSGMINSEYRILNCFSTESDEIMGKIYTMRDPATNRLKVAGIRPSADSMFLKWKMYPLERVFESTDLVGVHRLDLSKVEDLEDFHFQVEKAKKKGYEAFKADQSIVIEQLKKLNPNNPNDKDLYDALETRLQDLERSAMKAAAPVNKNHLMICKVDNSHLSPKNQVAQYVLAYVNQLYPISLMKEKFIKAHEKFIVATLDIDNQNTQTIMRQQFHPFADRVLVRPHAGEEKLPDSPLIIPKEVAFEAPVTGEVVAVGPGTDTVPMITEVGDTVMYRKMGAEEITLEGEKYLLMRQNDLLMKVPASKTSMGVGSWG